MKDISTISFSQISTYLFCPISYRFSYIDLTEKEKPNIYMVWGSAFHKALEINYKQKIETKKDLEQKQVTQVFLSAFKKDTETCIIPPYADVNTLSMLGENVIAKYMEEVAPDIHPLYSEYHFKLPLKKYPITIHGFIDLITEEGIIVDYKTIGKTTRKNWTQYKVDDSIQLTLYSAAYRKIFLKEEKGLAISLIPRENKPEFKTINTTRTKEQIDYVLHLATVIQDLKNKRIFYPNLNNCQNCAYNKICTRK